MRVKLITLMGGVLLILGNWRGLSAQVPGSDGVAGDATAIDSAPQGQVSAGAVPPQSGLPAEMAPWPEMSPYSPYHSRHYNDQGLWRNRTAGSDKQFFIGIDYLTGRARKPQGVLGDPRAMSYVDTIDLRNLTGGAGAAADFDDLADLLEDMEEASLHGLYSPLDLELLGKPNMQGARLRWGYYNPDESGFVLEAWFSMEPESVYDAASQLWPGRGTQQDVLLSLIDTPVDELDATTTIPRDLSTLAPLYRPLNVDEILQNNLLNLHGLPLDDGTLQTLGNGTTVGGVTVPYDLEFKAIYRVETWGGSLNWMATPRFRTEIFKVRPLAGVRFLQLRERFRFVGRDSGLTYGAVDSGNADVKIHSTNNQFDDDGDGIVDNAGIVEDDVGAAGGGGAAGTTTVTPTEFVQFRDPVTSLFPITSYLQNDIRSYLTGPEIGLQYELGGVRFKLSGHTKFALVANHEKIWLDGDNIAMITRDSDLLSPSAEDGTPNRFAEKDSSTHVSPMFEQTIIAEMPLFGSLPILKRVRLLQDTTFRFGYTFVAVGAVARPTESIWWQGNPAELDPLFPRIAVSRSTWYAGYWNFGVDWHY